MKLNTTHAEADIFTKSEPVDTFYHRSLWLAAERWAKPAFPKSHPRKPHSLAQFFAMPVLAKSKIGVRRVDARVLDGKFDQGAIQCLGDDHPVRDQKTIIAQLLPASKVHKRRT